MSRFDTIPHSVPTAEFSPLTQDDRFLHLKGFAFDVKFGKGHRLKPFIVLPSGFGEHSGML